MDQETFDLLALSLVPGLGTVRLNKLMNSGQNAGRILNSTRSELRKLGLSLEIQVYVASGCPHKEAERVANIARSKRITILSHRDGAYPLLLRQIFDPPLILYLLGSLDSLCHPSVAIVGSRRCSLYGKEVTTMLSRDLSVAGLNIVSGMARGIDSHAHRGALAAGGTTTAVLGSGIDVIYPREHRKLYGQIIDSGCVISEFPIGAYPAPQNFPVRNRIISGLSHGTLIPEATEFSGSLITARLTLEQDRELWAVPGNITASTSYGPNYLIKQGAQPVLAAQDVVDELPFHVLSLLKTYEHESTAQPQANLSPSEDQLMKLLFPDSTVHFDQLLEITRLPIPKLSSVLLSLEMKGLIAQNPGNQYSKCL